MKDAQSKNEFINSISEDKFSEMKLELKKDAEVQQLVRSLDINHPIQILEFGKEPAEQISHFSDRMLGTMHMTNVEDSGELLKQLGRVMDKFDKKDFEEVSLGFFSKFFKKSEKIIEKLFKKYQTLGNEMDKIYVEISKYKNELIESTNMLDEMYDQTYQYYVTLEKYVVAGEMKLDQLKTTKLPQLEAQIQAGDQLATMELDTLKKGIELLEQRIFDLEMAKMVALQTAPQIRLLQRGNTKLIAKMNSAFVTTIPIFKNSLIQAVTAKRQKLIADSMSELDRRTNELLLQNAETITKQSGEIARFASQPSIKLETIEQSWHIIMKGLEETLSIEEENKRIREEGKKRLKELQENFKKMKQT